MNVLVLKIHQFIEMISEANITSHKLNVLTRNFNIFRKYILYYRTPIETLTKKISFIYSNTANNREKILERVFFVVNWMDGLEIRGALIRVIIS